jgi:two-component system chemotaxis sensor kinase CheA
MARDPYRYFRVEARELLDQLGKGALELNAGSAAPELIALMLRLAHTLKGAARVVKQREIADQAHTIEDALTPFREPGLQASREGIGATLAALDAIAERMATLAPPSEGQPVAGAAEGSAAQQESAAHQGSAAQQGSSLDRAPLESLTSNVDDMDVLLEALSAASVQLAGLRRGMTSLQQSRRLVGAYRHLSDGVEQMDRELGQVREAAERLRLVPANLMFVPLERAARDVAQALNKRIAFITSGGNIRLDAQIFSAVQSALVQAVRNAVAHGIETSEQRELAGKPMEGRVSVEVRRRGQQVVFVCRDDGRGVDLEAVRRALERKGVAAAAAANLGTEELLRLVLRGGISTSGAVNQHSGRGIGLDVVREAVSRLRGEVSIRTDKGGGTALEIVVPVTLAAVDALIVESGGRVVAIPLDAVKRTLRVAIDDVVESSQGASIVFDGKVVPFAPLERTLAQAVPMREGARFWSAVVIEGATALAAVGVERLRGTQNVILRPLPDLAPCDPTVAGAALDAEGNPQLVLDPHGMVEQISRSGPLPRAVVTRPPILVIDDSLTTRMLEQSILESAGYEVDLAVSGEEGLERARKRRYVLFLVDVEMPGMNGFTFIERTLADPALRDIPAILVTSRAAPDDRRRGKDVGARAYIVKGEFDQSELLDKIRQLVGVQ